MSPSPSLAVPSRPGARRWRRALRSLGTTLADRGLRYHVAVVGGAALLLRDDHDRSTGDVDVAAVAEGINEEARNEFRCMREGMRDFVAPNAAFIHGVGLLPVDIAEMALEVNRASLVALHVGRMKDQGTLRPEHVSLGKMGNVRGALEVCRAARTILGANGVTLE